MVEKPQIPTHCWKCKGPLKTREQMLACILGGLCNACWAEQGKMWLAGMPEEEGRKP